MRLRRAFLPAAAILLVALVVRLYRLDHFSYWLDEVLEVRFIRGSWSEFWKNLRFDAVHPPLDYLIVRLLEPLRPLDWVRKIPAVLWGMGTVGVLGALLDRRAGRRPALLAMLFLSFAPYHVRYSQELRPYSLGLFLFCLSLLCLNRFLEKPRPLRLAALFLSALACAWSLYLAAVVLAVAGAGLVAEDCFSRDPDRRRTARRFVAASPLFLLGLWLAYLPWWPVVREAARRAPVAEPAPLTLARVDATLSFFLFAPNDGFRLGSSGAIALGLTACGAWIAARHERHRFLVIWAVAGMAAVEALGRIHPHFAATRRFLPAGLALTPLLALAVATVASGGTARRVGGLALAALMIAFDLAGLRDYFRSGRPDWRPLAVFLEQETSPEEKIFCENQITQLYLDHFLPQKSPLRNLDSVIDLNGQTKPLAWSWPAGTRAWLVLAGGPRSEDLRFWGEPFPTFSFPTGEGDALVKRLDAATRDEAMRRVR